MFDKRELIAALLQKLQEDLDLQTRAALLARDEATNEESRAESKWDTRGQEAAYLAEGQAKLATDLGTAMHLFRELDPSPTPPPAPIQLGSTFVLKQAGGNMHGLIGPRAGGVEFTFTGITYTVVTPMSPLGREVMGKRAGDFVNLLVRRQPRPHLILDTF